MKIALDAGHGTNSKNGLPYISEYEFNSAVVKYAYDKLIEQGYEVILTQPLNAKANSLRKRVDLAKTEAVDLLISVHADFNEDSRARGYWAFYWHNSNDSKEFAKIWLKHAQDSLPHPSRGLRASQPNSWCNFYINRQSNKYGIPAILIEHGFMSNSNDLELLKSDSFRQLSANIICSAVNEYSENKEDWRITTGKQAIKYLEEKQIISDPERWGKDLLEPLPAWVIWEVIRRTFSKLSNQ